MSDMRTPLRRVRGMGSAHGGTDHFWQQRLTAISNFILITIFANPIAGVAAALVIVSACVHMRLGMQTIIEDYVHGPMKWLLSIGNIFFACLIAGLGLYAIVKMSFGV